MKPAIRVEMSDFEQVWSTVQNMVLHPFETNLYHFIPLLGAFTWGYTPIDMADCGQASMIPKELGKKFFDAVETMCKCASFKGKIDLYTSLVFHFTSFGGSLSLTRPIIVIPYHRLFRPDGSSFGDGSDQSALTKNIHTLSDDETKFYISREIAHIKFGDVFLKSAARVVLIATLIFLYSAPLSWVGIAAVAFGAIGLVLFVDRVHEYAIDLFAVMILGKALGDPYRARAAALRALEKEREENLERRPHNRFCELYITPAGNNLLDLKHPLLTSRIAELRRCLKSESRSLAF